jgi:glucan phosphoethanolaminetransferase (alkaline phosphatase superfamily)
MYFHFKFNLIFCLFLIIKWCIDSFINVYIIIYSDDNIINNILNFKIVLYDYGRYIYS